MTYHIALLVKYARINNSNMSYRMRLGAILACDNRKGQYWA